MLKTIWLLLSLTLIITIFLRVPEETVGLSSTRINFLKLSPKSTQKSINYFIFLETILYFMTAVYFNIIN